MEVTITKNEEKTLVNVAGRIDTTTAEKFNEAVAPLMAPGAGNIEIDCSALDYTSSQGLRIFLMLQKAVSANKGSLVLTNMQPSVKEVFDITGFSSIIKII